MKILIRIVAFILISLSNHAQAQNRTTLDYSNFAEIPVLHQGRVKPLNSFARIHLKLFSGREKLSTLSANEWLAEALFDPQSATNRKLFLVRNDALKQQLGLPKNQKLFALNELQNGIKKTAPQIEKLITTEQKDRTKSQTDLLHLHENILSFLQLLRSFSLMLPLNLEIPSDYKNLINDEPNYIQIARIETQILDDLKSLTLHKGENYDYYNDEEKKLANIGFQLQMFRLAGENNTLLRLMPGQWETQQQNWFTPWALLRQGHGSPDSALYFEHWRIMANTYRNQDTTLWQTASANALKHIQNRTAQQVSPTRLKLEIFYSQAKPFHIASALYGLCIALLIIGGIKSSTRIQNIAFSTLGLAILTHSAGITARIIVLSRPPVGTLHESILFVSLICALCAFFIALRSKNNTVTFLTSLTGAVTGLALLNIAPYLLQKGEGMEMLVAVLNTNFWLATHVICITIGYGICAIAACVAHGYLIIRLMKKPPATLASIHQLLYRLTLVALLFTAVGTVLGGIWADQSWGRFWGWDPKENGALLIVLWLIWIQHGRQSGHLRPLSYAATTAYLNVIVALAWFGVNLLSVGLHSYGFTNNAATALGSFCAIETLFIGSLWGIIHLKERHAHVA